MSGNIKNDKGLADECNITDMTECRMGDTGTDGPGKSAETDQYGVKNQGSRGPQSGPPRCRELGHLVQGLWNYYRQQRSARLQIDEQEQEEDEVFGKGI